MEHKIVQEVVRDWCNEAGYPVSIIMSAKLDTVFIYTQHPSFFIGEAGCLYDKYKAQIQALGWGDISIVQLDDTFTPENPRPKYDGDCSCGCVPPGSYFNFF